MNDEEQAMKLAAQILIVAEALRPSMPRVSDLMDDAAITIGNLVDLEKVDRNDR